MGDDDDDVNDRLRQSFPVVPKGSAGVGTARPSLAERHRSGKPLTQVEVEEEIIRFIGLLEDRTDELAGRARLAAESEANHKALWASAFIQAEGTEKRRAADADFQTSAAFMRRKVEEALYQSCKESCNSLRAQLDALRSISANIRAQT